MPCQIDKVRRTRRKTLLSLCMTAVVPFVIGISLPKLVQAKKFPNSCHGTINGLTGGCVHSSAAMCTGCPGPSGCPTGRVLVKCPGGGTADCTFNGGACGECDDAY